MLRLERDGDDRYDINADKSYLEIQRERIYLATELGREFVYVLGLERQGRHPQVMHQPKEYVWAGTYHARRSNRPESYIGIPGEKVAASYKRPRIGDQPK